MMTRAPMQFEDLPTKDYGEAVRESREPFLEKCRTETPLLRLTSNNPELNVLLVSAPEDVLHVVSDADTFSSTDHPQSKRYDSDYTLNTARIYADAGLNLKNIAVWSDGAYHKRVRKLIQFAFTSSKITAKAPYIQAFIDEIIDELRDQKKVDFVPAFCRRLPSMVITREFVLQPSDVKLMMSVTDTVSSMVDQQGPANGTEVAAPVIVALQQMLLARMNIGGLPPESLLLDLANARVSEEPALNRDELMWLASLLLAAGGHTTGAMIAWSVYMLAARPDIQERLRSAQAMIEPFVEEVLRVHGPVPSGYRTVATDCTLRGAHIPKGTWLIVRWDSPNFDATKWPNPRTFDIDRPNWRQLTTFGHGKHACIGNLLARREITLTVATMLQQFKSIAFDGDADAPDLIPSFDVHILSRLPLILTSQSA